VLTNEYVWGIIEGEGNVAMRKDITKEESFFAVFCIESLAEALGMPGNEVYDLLTEKSDILDSCIIPSYEPLHTQGKAYIVESICDLMRERGVI
jgi:hypothetical protein